ncbi:MAG: CehA/McbA family metallohydrolase [Candidatus Latescibacterota bacterium]
MSFPVFESPYFGEGAALRWLRGNHHGHSNHSDGADDSITILRAYEDEGYDYLALSEHDCLLSPSFLQAHTTMCMLPAVEVTSRFHQTLLFLGADGALPKAQLTPKEIMDRVHASGGLFLFNHPNWLPFPDYATDELLDSLEGLRGMEIYTGVIRRMNGAPLATDRWDRLLTKGWRVFGHATDDQHCAGDQFIAWNCVQWHADLSPDSEGILDALSKGRFYASTGVEISDITTVDGGKRVLVSSDGEEANWITSGGTVFKTTSSGSGSCSAMECLAAARQVSDEGRSNPGVYLRVECSRKDGATAWSQPFWVRDGSN